MLHLHQSTANIFSRDKLIIKTLSLILSDLHLDSKDSSLPSDRHIEVNPYTLQVWISKENSHMTEDFGVFGFSFGGGTDVTCSIVFVD